MYFITHNLNDGEFSGINDVEVILRRFRHNQFVLVLQEIPRNTGELRSIVKKFPNLYLELFTDPSRDKHSSNLATISNMSITSVNQIRLHQLTNPLLRFIFGVWEKSDVPQHRALTVELESEDGTKVAVANTHFETLGGFIHKIRQFQQVLKTLPRDFPSIVIGDYNIGHLKAKFLTKILGYHLLGNPKLHTCTLENGASTNLPAGQSIREFLLDICKIELSRHRRDWMATSWEPKSVKETVLYDTKSSDHYPVVYELTEPIGS